MAKKKLCVLFRRTLLREVKADSVAEALALVPRHYELEHVDDLNDEERDFECLCEACGEPIWDDEESATDGEVTVHTRCADPDTLAEGGKADAD